MPGSPARMRKGPRVSGPLPAPNPSSSLEFRPDRQELLADDASAGRPAGAACVGGGTGVGGRSVHAETCSGGAGLRGKSSAKQERRFRGWGQLAVSVPRCLGAHCRVGAQTWPQRPPAGAPCHLCEPRSRREQPFAGPSEGGGSSPAARVCRAPRRLPGRPLAPPTSKTASTWGRDEGDQGEGTGAIRAQRAGSGRRERAAGAGALQSQPDASRACAATGSQGAASVARAPTRTSLRHRRPRRGPKGGPW